MSPTRVQIGIDENGLGSLLGPMVVTAVRIEIDGALIPTAKQFATLAKRAGIADSKAACAHGAMEEVEGLVLALLSEHLGVSPDSLDALVNTVALESDSELKKHCPPGEAPEACFADPVRLPAFGVGSTASQRRAAGRLRDRGAKLVGVRAGMICSKRMNLARTNGRSRFDTDLDTMVRLAAALSPGRDGPGVVAYCGKVGGRKNYASALTELAPLVSVLEETHERSSYAVPQFGEMHFVLDGDASEPAIGLASLVGKYLRELWTHRLNGYWQRTVPEAQPASGYHDPVTLRLVAATDLIRKERAFPDECFLRGSPAILHAGTPSPAT